MKIILNILNCTLWLKCLFFMINLENKWFDKFSDCFIIFSSLILIRTYKREAWQPSVSKLFMKCISLCPSWITEIRICCGIIRCPLPCSKLPQTLELKTTNYNYSVLVLILELLKFFPAPCGVSNWGFHEGESKLLASVSSIPRLYWDGKTSWQVLWCNTWLGSLRKFP